MALQPDSARPSIPLDRQTRAELAAWVAAHWDAVFGLLYRMTRSRHEAEDLTQETFLRAGQRRKSFTRGTNARAWLMRIATNAFLDARRRKQVARIEPLVDERRIAHPDAPATARVQNDELAQAMEAALGELAETPRLVFLLRTREELSFKEIADTIGTTEETARWHMLQARRCLMEKLENWI